MFRSVFYGMSILKIPILDEWSRKLNSLYTVKIQNDQYLLGFNEKILDYIDIISDVSRRFPLFDGIRKKSVIRFTDIYDYNVKLIMEILERMEAIREDIPILADLIFWNSLSLPEISLLTSDNEIVEIYINGGSAPIHIYHSRYGSIPTNLTPSRDGLNALIRISELVHGEGLYKQGGNLEVDLELPNKLYRLVIDGFPLTHGDYIMVIRRMINKYFNIEELISSGFLDREQFETISRVVDKVGNILIAGEPNSGKTTLLNAVIKLLPRRIRKIYFEEARELEDRRIYGDHQVFYRYSGIANNPQRMTQTIFTLRRSPDYIVIGEILTDNDIKIFLESLLLGLRVAATIHASNIDTLLERFRNAYGDSYVIPLLNLDLIIFTKRDIKTGRRYVDKIYMIDSDGNREEGVDVDFGEESGYKEGFKWM